MVLNHSCYRQYNVIKYDSIVFKKYVVLVIKCTIFTLFSTVIQVTFVKLFCFHPFPATEYHSGWARTNRVVLLSSNLHQPQNGAVGSGILPTLHYLEVIKMTPDANLA